MILTAQNLTLIIIIDIVLLTECVDRYIYIYLYRHIYLYIQCVSISGKIVYEQKPYHCINIH